MTGGVVVGLSFLLLLSLQRHFEPSLYGSVDFNSLDAIQNEKVSPSPLGTTVRYQMHCDLYPRSLAIALHDDLNQDGCG